jgi:hypothetical protein
MLNIVVYSCGVSLKEAWCQLWSVDFKEQFKVRAKVAMHDFILNGKEMIKFYHFQVNS